MTADPKGWIPLWRQSTRSKVWRKGTPAEWKLWCWILFAARTQPDGDVPVGCVEITSRDLASELGMKRADVAKRLRRLEQFGCIDLSFPKGRFGPTRISVRGFVRHRSPAALRSAAVGSEQLDLLDPIRGQSPGSQMGSAPGSHMGSAPGSHMGSAPGSHMGSAPGSHMGTTPMYPDGVTPCTHMGTTPCTHMGSDPKVVEKEDKDLSAPEFDFGSLYESYPRRVGRAKGLEVCAKKVTTRADYEQLEAAVSAMARAWDGAPRDQLRYCPHFATWVNQERWRDTEQEGPAGAVAVVRADPDYDPDNPDPPEVQRAMREMYRDAPPPEL